MKGVLAGILVLLAGAALGDADALYKQGAAAFKADPAKAFLLFQQAGAEGNVSAMVGAAHCLETGTGTAVDYAGAIEWYEKAVAQNSTKACEGLVRIYISCPDPEFHDAEMAVKYAMAVARRNPRDADALMRLALAQYKNGNFDGAVQCLEKAKRINPQASLAALFQQEGSIDPLAGIDWNHWRIEWGKQLNEAVSVYCEAITLLSSGKQTEAEDLLDTQLVAMPDCQRLVFLRGCLERSRFSVKDAAGYFRKTIELGDESSIGGFAQTMLKLDEMGSTKKGRQSNGKRIESTMNNILKGIKSGRQDEVIFRWMYAVQCRAFRINAKEAVKQYEYVLDQWEVGPVLVHQTMANILSEQLNRHEEALVHRKIAVELDPKGWTYQGYGNTLLKLGRSKEACEWLQKAVNDEPQNFAYQMQLKIAKKAAGIE